MKLIREISNGNVQSLLNDTQVYEHGFEPDTVCIASSEEDMIIPLLHFPSGSICFRHEHESMSVEEYLDSIKQKFL